jgi:hypothetical protein
MKRLLIIIALSLTLFSCNNKSKEQQPQGQELPTEKADTTQYNSDIKAADVDPQIPPIVTKNTEKSKDRKLRFLHYSNVDLRAYFDDGTIITCPRCELTKENVETIQSNLSDEPVQTYELKDDGSLLIDGWKHEYPYVNRKETYEGWAMINYKWFVKL